MISLIYLHNNRNKDTSIVCFDYGKQKLKVGWKCQGVSMGNLIAQYQCKVASYIYQVP